MNKPSDAIYIDADDTLIVNGQPNANVIGWIRTVRAEEPQTDIVLWSRSGSRFARAVAVETGTQDVFTAILGKPTIIVDVDGANWITATRLIKP